MNTGILLNVESIEHEFIEWNLKIQLKRVTMV